MSIWRDLPVWSDDEPIRPAANPAAWMLTFADLVSLMLTFFVLLFAMSSIESGRWHELTRTLAERLNPGETASADATADRNIAHVREPGPGEGLDYLATLFEAVIADTPLFRDATVRLENQRLVVSLPRARLLAADGAPAPAGRALLSGFAEILGRLSNRVAVAVPVEGDSPEGWTRALARAAGIAESLRSAGLSQPVRAYAVAPRGGADVVDLLILPGRRPPS